MEGRGQQTCKRSCAQGPPPPRAWLGRRRALVSASTSWVSFVPSSVRASAVAARTSRGGLQPAGHWQEDAVSGRCLCAWVLAGAA